jgi:gamma-glutamylputrescine oxidase
VIGAGYTGLTAALHLAKAGYDVVLLEAQRVGFGASGRNGGQVGSGQRLEQDALERSQGKDDARLLWQIAEDAKAEVQLLIRDHGIDCAYKPGVAHADWHAGDVGAAHAYAEKLARDYGYDQIEPLDRDKIGALIGSDVFHGGTLDRGAGHLHPLRYALGLARAAAEAGVRIFERSEVHSLTSGDTPSVQTRHGMATCNQIVLAANGYHGHLVGQVANKVMPINNFIVATEPLGKRADEILAQDIAVADSKFVVNYWRLSEDRRLLFGGGESYGYKFPKDIAGLVRKPMLAIYPQLADAKITHAWGGTLAITMSRMPYFGHPMPNVFSAAGYSGHGVAMASLAGRIIAETIAGHSERFDVMARVALPNFPGGAGFRSPILALAMTWYSLRDRIGI